MPLKNFLAVAVLDSNGTCRRNCVLRPRQNPSSASSHCATGSRDTLVAVESTGMRKGRGASPDSRKISHQNYISQLDDGTVRLNWSTCKILCNKNVELILFRRHTSTSIGRVLFLDHYFAFVRSVETAYIPAVLFYSICIQDAVQTTPHGVPYTRLILLPLSCSSAARAAFWIASLSLTTTSGWLLNAVCSNSSSSRSILATFLPPSLRDVPS